MTTITKGATTITPDQVLEYEATSESRNVEHQIIAGTIDVSLANDLPREGRLELFFLTRAAAWAARDLHKTAGVFTLADATLTQLNMTYVRRGDMTIRLDRDTRVRWTLTVGFREVV